MKLAFFTSSNFTIPMIQSILDYQGKSLITVAKEQAKNLKQELTQDQIFALKKILMGRKKIQLQLIVSQPEKLNRGKVVKNPILEYARASNIAIYTPEKLNKEIKSELDKIDLGIVASYGQIISQKILDTTKFGFVNWHPSLLPKLRGASPIQSSILSGELETGLSWIEMTAGMDSGDLLMQLPCEIEDYDNFDTLSKHFGQVGAGSWALAIAYKLLGQKTPQKEELATYCTKITKEQALVNPGELTADQIHWHYQAFFSYPFTKYQSLALNQEIKILDCKPKYESGPIDAGSVELKAELIVIKAKEQEVYLRCANKTLLELKQIQYPNGQKTFARDIKF